MRKQFGLLMLSSASVHVCVYMLTYTRTKSNVALPEPNFENQTVDWGSEIKVLKGYTDMEVQDSLFLVSTRIGIFCLTVPSNAPSNFVRN